MGRWTIVVAVLAGLTGCVERGENCAGPRACVAGLTCVAWSTIAGEEMHTCERTCRGDGSADDCPDGEVCASVADGPGLVCVVISQ